MNRREFIRRVAVASVFLAIGAVGVLELAEKLVPAQAAVQLTGGGSQASQTSAGSTSQSSQVSQSSQTLQTIPQGYIYVGKIATLGAATSAYFTHPNYGNSILLLFSGLWKAFTATCTHQPCTVEYTNSEIYCPCHGGTFNPSNGAVTGGPPPSPLTEFAVLLQGGDIYVSSKAI